MIFKKIFRRSKNNGEVFIALCSGVGGVIIGGLINMFWEQVKGKSTLLLIAKLVDEKQLGSFNSFSANLDIIYVIFGELNRRHEEYKNSSTMSNIYTSTLLEFLKKEIKLQWQKLEIYIEESITIGRKLLKSLILI